MALHEDCVAVLPRKHCAFRHCTWSGAADEELLAHVSAHHTDSLYPVMRLLDVGLELGERVCPEAQPLCFLKQGHRLARGDAA